MTSNVINFGFVPVIQDICDFINDKVRIKSPVVDGVDFKEVLQPLLDYTILLDPQEDKKDLKYIAGLLSEIKCILEKPFENTYEDIFEYHLIVQNVYNFANVNAPPMPANIKAIIETLDEAIEFVEQIGDNSPPAQPNIEFEPLQ